MAKLCYDEMMQEMTKLGYLPYRTGPTGYDRLRKDSSVFWDVAGQLKVALDPKGLISPGRYVLKTTPAEFSLGTSGDA